MDTANNRGPDIILVMWIMTVVPAMFLGLRLYCKSRYSGYFGWDDYILVTSWVFLTVYTILTTASVTKGVGRHFLDIRPDSLVDALRLLYVAEFFAIIACDLSKTSFAVTLLRIMPKTWHKAFLWFVIISMNVVMVLCSILQFVQCSPSTHLWDFSIPAKCWDPSVFTTYAIFAGSYSAAIDFTLVFFPWMLLWNLQMKPREKAGVALAMSMGAFAGATAIVKTSYLPDVSKQTDFTYFCANLIIWAAAETGVTIISTSIPFLRKLAKARSSDNHEGETTYSGSHHLKSVSKRGSAHPRVNAIALQPRNPDDRSDKSILGPSESNVIVCAQEFTVSYQEGNEQGNGATNFNFGLPSA